MAEKQTSIIMRCPSCQTRYDIPATAEGKTLTCKKCKKPFVVKAPAGGGKLPLIAKMALESKLIGREQLLEALRIQAHLKKKGHTIPFEKILLQKKMIDAGQARRLLVAAVRQMEKDFGQLSMEHHNVSPERVKKALDEQASRFQKNGEVVLVGDMLVSSGEMAAKDRDRIYALQKRPKRMCAADFLAERTEAPASGNSVPAEKKEFAVDENAERGTAVSEPSAVSSESGKGAEIGSEVKEMIASKQEVFQDKKFFAIRKKDKDFAKAVIERKWVTEAETAEALAEQLRQYEKQNRRVLIGDLLVEAGIISAAQRDGIWLEQQRHEQIDKRFTEIGIEKGFFLQNHINKALFEQRKLQESGKMARLGDIFLESGVLTKEQFDTIWDVLGVKEASFGEEEVKREIHLEGGDFELLIAKDASRAYLIKKTACSEGFSLDALKAALGEEGISRGIVADDLIEEFLRNDADAGERILIAEGKPAKAGRPGSLKYHFDTQHLKVGSVDEDGQIDFKNRGEIPHVSKGDVIVERLEGIQGEEGFDVLGNVLPCPPVKDAALRLGSGVGISDDGNKVYAKIDGQPDIALNGKISVLAEITIKGDLGMETGHVTFDGHVTVKETVQSGFKVNVGSLKAREILDAEITSAGDVVVADGINGATIQARGNVLAKYMKNATITCFGDVVAVKEIIDCTIETSGVCRVVSGKVISSEISAKLGIEAVDVGTDISAPCRLQVGVNTHLDREIEARNAAIEALREKRKTLEEKLSENAEQEKKIEADIAIKAQEQDRALVAQRTTREEIAAIEAVNDSEELAKVKAALAELEEKAKRADEEVNRLFDQQDALMEDNNRVHDQLKALDGEIDACNDEKMSLIQWAEKESGKPIVKVRGEIYEGTTISGPHTSLILRNTAKNSQVREVRSRKEDPDSDWVMSVQALRR